LGSIDLEAMKNYECKRLLAFDASSPSDSPKDSDGLEKNVRLRAERKRRS
jgi:hypothetical protein